MPVLDEEAHLVEAVQAILASSYAGPLEVVLALGPSRDGTDTIASRLAETDPRVVTVPNPTGRTAAALNAAIAAARHSSHCSRSGPSTSIARWANRSSPVAGS